MKESVCPHCDYVMGSHFNAENPDLKPSPGDVGICASCAQYLVFDDNLTMRMPTKKEHEEIHGDHRVMCYQQAIRNIKKGRYDA